MTTKQTSNKTPEKSRLTDHAPSSSSTSVLPETSGLSPLSMIAKRVANGDRDSAPLLYRMVAALIHTHLRPPEADVVATWFERMAAGEAPDKVLLPRTAGRPRKATAKRKPMSDGTIPDDIDVAWLVRQAREHGISAGEVYRGVGKGLGMPWRTVERIYLKLKDTLA